jgi:hypothetical protein
LWVAARWNAASSSEWAAVQQGSRWVAARQLARLELFRSWAA